MIKQLDKHTLITKRDSEFFIVWVGKRNTWEIAYFNNTQDILDLDLLEGRKGSIMQSILELTDHSKKIYFAETEEDVNNIIGVKVWAT
jgi:hypothetical protein